MKRGYMIIGICSLFFVTWGLLLFTLFGGSDSELDQLSTNDNETLFNSYGEEFEQLEEEELTEDDLSLEDSNDNISEKETIRNSNDDISEDLRDDSPKRDDRNIHQLINKNISISKRGILPGDFDGLTTNGVVSVDVVLDILAEEENSE